MCNSDSFRNQCLLVMSAAVWCVLSGAHTSATPQARSLTAVVDDARPLAAAIELLEKRHGWVITYEDPPFVHDTDFSDATAKVRRDSQAGKPRVLIPRGGPFVFDYAIPGNFDPPEARPVLEALVTAYASTGYPGRFVVRQSDNVFHVVPVMGKNSRGTMQTHRSVLDVRVSIAARDRSGLEMLDATAGAVSAAIQEPVALGLVPVNALARIRIREGAANEPARAVLSRTLAATGRRYSWQLFFNPEKDGGRYFLNIHVVGGGE